MSMSNFKSCLVLMFWTLNFDIYDLILDHLWRGSEECLQVKPHKSLAHPKIFSCKRSKLTSKLM
jgi:hypothetical protein